MARAGDAEAAVAYFTRALASGELSAADAAVAYRNRGNARLRSGDIAGAAEDFAAAAPGDPGAWFNLGAVRFEQGDLPGADDAFAAALRLDPLLADAALYRGRIAVAGGEWRLADTFSTRAIAIGHEGGDAWLGRAMARRALGAFEDAEADAGEALQHDEALVAAWVLRGWLRFARGDLPGALGDYERALALAPDDAGAAVNRAAVLGRMGRYEAAIAAYSRFLSAVPDHAAALAGRGTAYRLLGETAAAVADHSRVVALEPASGRARLARGLDFAAAGELEAARVDLIRATELDPELGRAWSTLGDIDLTVNAGEVVAIVGPSGAGKSTLLNLLPRFFDPTAGRILIDGADLKSLKLSSLRSQVAVVTQETFLFDETVFNNIAYGQPNTPREQVIRAAQAAIADDFIQAMPDGYETNLGERGYRLSGGQRQRISIARALLKDAPILLLDEATSHLDTESEMLVQQALGNLMKGRTVIVVAHRLSTIRSADKIVVVEDGKIVDIGKHDRLLAASPVYQRLFELQSVDRLD